MSDRRDDDLNAFRASQEGGYTPGPVLYERDDLPVDDDAEDERIVPDDDRVVPLEPDDTDTH